VPDAIAVLGGERPRPLGEEAATLEVTGFAPREALATRAVEVLDGDIGAHATRLVAAATSEVCVIATAEMLWDIPFGHTRARWRALLPRGAPSEIASGSAGSKVRTVERPPLGAFIVDRSIALLPVGRVGHGEATLLVHPGGLLRALQALFEHTWTSADPLHGAAAVSSRRPCPEDLQLLRLLLGGYTDEAIASRLDVGARTVQRRVHDLIETAGVRTRLQLIWHATRRGWI
jgi:DNA-binding CsgD family transcriptional regulator